MYELKIYISNRLKKINDIINLSYLLKKNNNINIINHENYDNIDKLDLIIRYSGIFSYEYLDIMYINKIFIINFRDKYKITQYYNYSNDLSISPFTFINGFYTKFYIQQQLDYYNKLYNNNLINKSFGNKYWMVKSINTNSFDTLILSDQELLNYNNNDIYIQKYFENPYLIDNKKYSIRAHFFIFPKIIKINDIYSFKYDHNNNIQYKFYFNNFLLKIPFYNDSNPDNIQNIHNIPVDTYKHFIDDDISKLIIESCKKLNKNNNFINIIYQSIYGYPYFGQIFAIDYNIDINKKNIYIDRVTTSIAIVYDEINKSNILNAFFQKLFKSIFKIKYNKLITFKKKYTKDLILI